MMHSTLSSLHTSMRSKSSTIHHLTSRWSSTLSASCAIESASAHRRRRIRKCWKKTGGTPGKSSCRTKTFYHSSRTMIRTTSTRRSWQKSSRRSSMILSLSLLESLRLASQRRASVSGLSAFNSTTPLYGRSSPRSSPSLTLRSNIGTKCKSYRRSKTTSRL